MIGNWWGNSDSAVGEGCQSLDKTSRGHRWDHRRYEEETVARVVGDDCLKGIHLPGAENNRYDNEVSNLHRAVGQGIGTGVSVDDDIGLGPGRSPRSEAVAQKLSVDATRR